MVFLSEGLYIRSPCLIETFKVRWYIETKAGTVATFVRFSPLLVTSAIANFGTLTLCIAVEREFALFYILVVLLSNFFVVLLPPSAIASALKYLGFSSTLPPRGSAKRDQHALFMTWTNRSRVKDPHFLAKNQQKMAFFEKNWILGPKRPPRGASPTWNMYLYGGHLFQAFWTKKIQPGRQEGPKTAKMGYFWRYQNSSVFSKIAIFCCFLAKKWGSFTRERLVEMNFFIK